MPCWLHELKVADFQHMCLVEVWKLFTENEDERATDFKEKAQLLRCTFLFICGICYSALVTLGSLQSGYFYISKHHRFHKGLSKYNFT